MAACSSGTGLRRRWFLTLSLVAALAVVAAGTLLWHAVELTSLAAVSEHVNRAMPLLGGVRLALIGLLAAVWPWLPALRLRGARNEPARARWMVLRWRVVGWLLVIELVIGQNLFARFVGLIAHPA
jgi:hypothetical protein